MAEQINQADGIIIIVIMIISDHSYKVHDHTTKFQCAVH